LYKAADNPQTVPELVKQRIAAETEQTEKLYGFDFKIAGNSVTTNQIDEMLRTSMATRRSAGFSKRSCVQAPVGIGVWC
jgi:peptidyl-dipeptidase A